MANRAFNQPQSLALTTASGRRAMLENLASLASVLVSERLEDFCTRLGDALLSLSEQSGKPGESKLSFNGFNYLRTRRQQFQAEVIAAFGAQLAQVSRPLLGETKPQQAGADLDLSLVTFDEMENKVLLGNIGQALEQGVAEPLEALGVRLADLLQRPELSLAENPFRPQVFVEALYHGWRKINPEAESHKVMLRLLGPDLFLPLDAILRELNATLVEHGILPDLSEVYRRKRSHTRVGVPAARVANASQPYYNKVRDWLLSGMKKGGKGGKPGKPGKPGKGGAGKDGEPEDLNVPDLFAPPGSDGNWSPNTISIDAGPRLFGYLAAMQRRLDTLEAAQAAQAAALGQIQAPASATTLRQVGRYVPPGTLTQLDENTIELLARIFDALFSRPDIPAPVRTLVGRLQLPLLKAALSDKKFFIRDDHPARQLIDKLISSGMALDRGLGSEDPLYRALEKIVERVQKDYEHQVSLFHDAAGELDAALAQEGGPAAAEEALAQPIAAALRAEKQRLAQQAAQQEVAKRIDSGEVAGFLESFLERQWTRILALAYGLRERKPDVLQKALDTMDDLIWSIQPKGNAQERRELLTRLPAILSMTNAWLNAIKWEGAERTGFFSSLAERHAAIARMQADLTPRQQVELAVNIAQRASERRMRHRYGPDGKGTEQAGVALEDLHVGDWLDFARQDGAAARLRLAWVSPHKSRYIFTNRKGGEALTFDADGLAQSLRDGQATRLRMDSAVGQALATALESAA